MNQQIEQLLERKVQKPTEVGDVWVRDALEVLLRAELERQNLDPEIDFASDWRARNTGNLG